MAYTAPCMLATGDYGGRICVWNIFTGERRCTLTHEAPEYQRGVEQLLFLRSPELHASPVLLSCGGMHSYAVLQSSGYSWDHHVPCNAHCAWLLWAHSVDDFVFGQCLDWTGLRAILDFSLASLRHLTSLLSAHYWHLTM